MEKEKEKRGRKRWNEVNELKLPEEPKSGLITNMPGDREL